MVVQWPDTVVVDGEPIQVKEREMVVVPEGDFVHYEMERSILTMNTVRRNHFDRNPTLCSKEYYLQTLPSHQ